MKLIIFIIFTLLYIYGNYSYIKKHKKLEKQIKEWRINSMFEKEGYEKNFDYEEFKKMKKKLIVL